MKVPLSLAACTALACHAAVAAEPTIIEPDLLSPAAAPEWLTDANGCKFLKPWAHRSTQAFTIEWDGACVEGFVDGPGELSVGPVLFRGEFSRGRIVKGTAEGGGFTFEGTFVDNAPNGEMLVRASDGFTVKATFDRGKMDPRHAEVTWPNGTRYRGEIEARTLRMNGKGILEYGNGSVYEGEFKQGRLEGVGVYKGADGEVRRGTFVADQLEGRGSILYADQSRYEGELRAGAPHGQGRIDFTNGSYYEGAFVSGKYQGRGKLKYPQGSIYEGDFLAGESSGSGTLTYADGSSYVGQFLYGKRDGTGRLTRASGEIYEGEWKGDGLTGKCRMVFEQGVYDGQCLNGKASGTGRLEDEARKMVYEGEFRDDRFEGQGSLRRGELVYEGAFKGGVIEGSGTLSIGKLRARGDFKSGVMVRGTVDAEDGRTFEVDMEKGEILEVMRDGSKRPVDQLPAEITI